VIQTFIKNNHDTKRDQRCHKKEFSSKKRLIPKRGGHNHRYPKKKFGAMHLIYGIKDQLTPKGPDYVFWLYSDFGQVPTTRNFQILG